MDFTEGFFTPNPDDTVLSSEITLENHIHLAYLHGESHVHWILRCRNEPSAEDNNFSIPVLPIFGNDETSRGGSCQDDHGKPAIQIPWGGATYSIFSTTFIGHQRTQLNHMSGYSPISEMICENITWI